MFNTFHDIPLHNIFTSFFIHFIFATMKLSLSFVFAFQEILFLEHTTRNEWEIIFFLLLLHEKRRRNIPLFFTAKIHKVGAPDAFIKYLLIHLVSLSVNFSSYSYIQRALLFFLWFLLSLLSFSFFYMLSFRCYRK